MIEIGQKCGDRLVDLLAVPDHPSANITVIIPTVYVVLDTVDEHRVTDAVFDHSPGQEALPAEGRRGGVVEPVEPLDMCGFTGKVHHAGSSGLHAEGEFVRVDASLKIGGIAALLEVAPVEKAEQVEFFPLLWSRKTAGAGQIQDGCPGGAKQCSLVGRRQVPVGPHRGPVHGSTAGVLDDHVPWHVLVSSAQPVGHPRAHRRASGKLAAGGDMQR